MRRLAIAIALLAVLAACTTDRDLRDGAGGVGFDLLGALAHFAIGI